LTPFFEALGWDVANKRGVAPQYQDVVHEATVRIRGAAHAPDYGFRVGPQLKFFVEAKKPSVDIATDSQPAYRLRRYGWSAKLALSVLTEQLTIDRIIFLRICEDRSIEPAEQLRNAATGAGVYPRLMELFRRADDRYNSGLFHFRAEKGHKEYDPT